jgi:hypothetical protein
MDNSNNHHESNPDERLREACLHWVQCLNHHINKESYCATLRIIFDYLISNNIYELNDPFFGDVLEEVSSREDRQDLIKRWGYEYAEINNVGITKKIIKTYVIEKLFLYSDVHLLRAKIFIDIADDLLKYKAIKSTIKEILLLAFKETQSVQNKEIKWERLRQVATIAVNIKYEELVILAVQEMYNKKYDYLTEEQYKLFDKDEYINFTTDESGELFSRFSKDWINWIFLETYPEILQMFKLRFMLILTFSRTSKRKERFGFKENFLTTFKNDFINNFDSQVVKKLKLLVALREINDGFDHSKYWHDYIKSILGKIEKTLKN